MADPETKKKKGAPPCGLYLQIDENHWDGDLEKKLREFFFVVNRSNYEKNMHVVELDVDMSKNSGRYELLVGLIQNNGIVVLGRGSFQKAMQYKMDGVIVTSLDQIATAREICGDDKILAYDCKLSDHVARKAHELGVDCVLFGSAEMGPPSEILRKWSLTSLDPFVAYGPINNDNCGGYVEDGAAFIDATSYIMTHEDGVMKGSVNMLYAIELALEQQKQNLN